MLKISVITPAYNHGEFIQQTIESVLAQNYPNFEHIIVDGGSTDNTVEILKSYPHLIWSSERDNGQTDALNRGLSKATGDVIAWMNSDDWFATGAFERIAAELERYPVVVGECAITDREGRVTDRVVNVPRSWFDILKHWIPYSIPTQPAIFFRRELVDEFRLPDGKLLDEELDYCMDFELWLRIFKRYEFRKIDALLCYYRMYETNKTGGTGTLDALQPEMARIFKRHELDGFCEEQLFSVIIPATTLDSALTDTLRSLAAQSFRGYEVIVVDYSTIPEDSKHLRNTIRDHSKGWFALRYAKARAEEIADALNTGFELSCGRYLVYLGPGAVVAEDFLLQCANGFQEGRVGLQLPVAQNQQLAELLVTADGELSLDGFFSVPHFPLNFALRKVALAELGGFPLSASALFIRRALLLRMLFKGWRISVAQELAVEGGGVAAPVDEQLSAFVSAGIVVALDDEFSSDPFATMRAEHGCTIRFEPGFVENCQRFLIEHSQRLSLLEAADSELPNTGKLHPIVQSVGVQSVGA